MSKEQKPKLIQPLLDNFQANLSYLVNETRNDLDPSLAHEIRQREGRPFTKGNKELIAIETLLAALKKIDLIIEDEKLKLAFEAATRKIAKFTEDDVKRLELDIKKASDHETEFDFSLKDISYTLQLLAVYLLIKLRE